MCSTARTLVMLPSQCLLLDTNREFAGSLDVDLREMKYSRAQAGEFYSRLRSRIGDIPGVESVSLADVQPFGNERVVSFRTAGDIAAATVDSHYFRTMGIPLLRGRGPPC